jgi:hypothetical protein
MTSLKVSSTAELISAVPYLIGFHPADSLTVVAARGRRLAFAVRIDLPELRADPEEARAAILHLASVVASQGIQAVTIIGYGDSERVTPAVQRLSESFGRAGITVIDEVRVADGRYWSYTCPECCPEEGIPCEPPDSVLAAEATFAGAVALPSREALADQLAPVTGADREAMIAATARAELRLADLAAECCEAAEAESHDPEVDSQEAELGESRRPNNDESRDANDDESREAGEGESQPVGEDAGPLPNEALFLQAVNRAGREAVREAERRYRAGARLTDDEAAWLGLLLLHLPVRDYAWLRANLQDYQIALWADLVRRVEPAFIPAPASLLAFVAWRTGAGALASIAIERALTHQPSYTMAIMMLWALVDGLRPQRLDGWPLVEAGL